MCPQFADPVEQGDFTGVDEGERGIHLEGGKGEDIDHVSPTPDFVGRIQDYLNSAGFLRYSEDVSWVA